MVPNYWLTSIWNYTSGAVNGSAFTVFEKVPLPNNYLYVMYVTAGECAEMLTGYVPLNVTQTTNGKISFTTMQ